ncbi:hypothetical protein LJR220_001696 [Bradyrhizobium sp. LjRoot220]|uniref:hypothetical protein n=1 Tax=Bradyrhizobium sp. LjRoot220 TaxID=3342284 RepID=UPI003ECD40DD
MTAVADSNTPANEILADEAMQSVTGGTAGNYVDDGGTIVDNSVNNGRSNGVAAVSNLHHLGQSRR